MIGRIDHDIGWLHIPENDRVRLVGVQEGEHVAQLNCPTQDTFLCQKAAGFIDDGFQVFAVDEFQHQVGTIILTEIIINPRNGRVVEGCQDIGFTFKILDNGLSDQRIGGAVDHLFDRHQFHHTGKMQVTGTINRTHAAHADHFLDHIAIDKRCSRGQLYIDRPLLCFGIFCLCSLFGLQSNLLKSAILNEL